MKSTSFYCSYDYAFKMLQTIMRRKGYIIAAASHAEGRIKARHKDDPALKSKVVNIKIFKIDEHETGITLMINSNEGMFDIPLTSDQMEEVILSESINKFF